MWAPNEDITWQQEEDMIFMMLQGPQDITRLAHLDTFGHFRLLGAIRTSSVRQKQGELFICKWHTFLGLAVWTPNKVPFHTHDSWLMKNWKACRHKVVRIISPKTKGPAAKPKICNWASSGVSLAFCFPGHGTRVPFVAAVFNSCLKNHIFWEYF